MREIKVRYRNSDQYFNAMITALIFIYIVIIVYPLIYIISASFSNPLEVISGRMWLVPRDLNYEGYKLAFRNRDIFVGYGNTIFYAIFGTLFCLVITLSGAYPLARKRLFGKNLIMGYFVFTMFFSGGLIPTFMVARSLSLYNTTTAMLVWGTVSVYNIIVARSFMNNTIDEALYEAASIDGCTDVQAFFRIALPLCGPILSVLILFYAVGFWNSYFNALIYLSNRNLYPLQLFLREILLINMTDAMTEMSQSDLSKFLVSESTKYAVVIISSLPMLILYPFMQRFFVKGIMIGSIKG